MTKRIIISFSSPYYLSFLCHCTVLLHDLNLSTLTLRLTLWPFATSSSLGILRTVDYPLTFLCACCCIGCFLLVNACSSPISLTGIAQNPRVLSTHYWFWAAFPSAAICTYFFLSEQLYPVPAPFLPSLEMHWACASCTVSFQLSIVPSIQAQTVQYPWVLPQHTKFPQQYFSSVGTSTSCSRSFIQLPRSRATSKVLNAL